MKCAQCGKTMKLMTIIDDNFMDYICKCGYKAMKHKRQKHTLVKEKV